jgi:hypothetical protein
MCCGCSSIVGRSIAPKYGIKRCSQSHGAHVFHCQRGLLSALTNVVQVIPAPGHNEASQYRERIELCQSLSQEIAARPQPVESHLSTVQHQMRFRERSSELTVETDLPDLQHRRSPRKPGASRCGQAPYDRNLPPRIASAAS